MFLIYEYFKFQINIASVSHMYFPPQKNVINRSSGSRIERTGKEETEETWNILRKLEQSLDTIGKSVVDCRRGQQESNNVGPSTTSTSSLSSLSEKLDNIQARLNILPNVRKGKDKNCFQV